MKKLIIILFAILLLCSCSKEPAPPASENSVPEVPNSEQLLEEPPEDEKPPEKEPTDPVEQAKVAEVRGMWYSGYREKWEDEGFSATPGNVTFFEDDVFSYAFTINTGEIIFSFPAKGTLAFNDMENFSAEKQGNHIHATWGCEGVLENGVRYFITLGKIVMVDEDFEFVGQILLPENSYYHMWPMSVAVSEDGEYVIPVCRIPKNQSEPTGGIVLTYGANFELLSEAGEIPFLTHRFGDYYIPQFSEKSYTYSFKNAHYLSSVLEYNLDENTAFFKPGEGYSFFDGDYSVSFIKGKKYEGEEDYNHYSLANYVLLKEGHDIIDYMELEEEFGFAPGTEDSSLALADISESARKAEVYDDFYHRTITVNFRKKNVEAEYVFEEKHLTNLYDKSDDGKYSLYAVSETSGGDSVAFNLVLKNNETGETRYMFSNGIANGFLRNGDIYRQEWDSLRIYSPETGELLFAMEDKFPFNFSDNEEDYRCLLAFRRDPNDLSFMIVYWEGEHGVFTEEDPDEYPVYKIAFLTADGTLLRTYESEIPVELGMYQWPLDSVIYYRDGKYTITNLESKDNKGINFVFDSEAETFSEPKKNK